MNSSSEKKLHFNRQPQSKSQCKDHSLERVVTVKVDSNGHNLKKSFSIALLKAGYPESATGVQSASNEYNQIKSREHSQKGPLDMPYYTSRVNDDSTQKVYA